jgi:hypothetical protein
MPAMTRPRSSRPRSPRSSARPRTARPYTPAIASDGLTVDTELGSVDLVAVRRALRGDDRVRLSEAEIDWICQRQRRGARREAADVLGTGYTGLLKDLARHRRRLTAVHGGAADTRPTDLEEG